MDRICSRNAIKEIEQWKSFTKILDSDKFRVWKVKIGHFKKVGSFAGH